MRRRSAFNEAGQVTKEARFVEDLDADSLDLAELVMELEEEFDITVEEEELKTFQQLVMHLI